MNIDASDIDNMRVRLYDTRAHALAGGASIDLDTGPATGDTHSLTKVEGPSDDQQGSLTLGSTLQLHAQSTNTAEIDDISIGASAITIKSLSPKITTGGSTDTYVGGFFGVTAPGIHGEAISTNTPKKDSVNISVTAVGIDVNNTELETTHDTAAFVSRQANFTLNGGGTLELAATSTNDAEFSSFALNVSAVPIGDFKPDVDAGGWTHAYVGEGATVTAGNRRSARSRRTRRRCRWTRSPLPPSRSTSSSRPSGRRTRPRRTSARPTAPHLMHR